MRDITFEVTTSGTVKLSYDFYISTVNGFDCYYKDAVGKNFSVELPYQTEVVPAANDASRKKLLYARNSFTYQLSCGEGIFFIEFTAYDGTPQSQLSSPFSHSFTSDFIGNDAEIWHHGLRVHAYGTNGQDGNPTGYTLVDPDVIKTGRQTRLLHNIGAST